MANTIEKPAPLDLTSVPTADQLAGRRVNASLNGDQLESSSIENEGRKKLFEGNGSQKLGKQDFLNLLVTQLRHQDPLEPAENTEFVAQLAQFSSLEGTQNISTAVEDLGKQIKALVGNQASSATAMSNASATSMIGKEVRVSAEGVSFDPSSKEPIKINVHTDPGTASVLSIVDSKGEIVNVVAVPKPGENELTWDGTTKEGHKAPRGRYELKVTSPDGLADTGYAYLKGRVEGVSYTKDGMRLEVGGQQVAMDKIMRVSAVDEEVQGD